MPGWYDDPEMAGRLRYWDGSQWTEHLAAAPVPTYPAPMRPTGFYQPQAQQHVTLFNNPHRLPPRTPRRTAEDALSTAQRIRAAAVDAALVIPFIVIGLCLAPALAWISGDSAAKGHAYHGAALVLALVLGIGFVFWNFVIRETTLGTDLMNRSQKSPTPEEPASAADDDA